jgi:AbrB family looped-hinge helix DNA binding protein
VRFVHDTLPQRVTFGSGEAAAHLEHGVAALGASRVMVIASKREMDTADRFTGNLPAHPQRGTPARARHRPAAPRSHRLLRDRNHFHGMVNGMRATIDKAGRLVIPKALRDSLGLVPGEVEVTPDGAGLHVEPLANDYLADEDGFLVIPADAPISDESVRTLRDADQR